MELIAPAYQVTPAVLPKKLLAVYSGLAACGRNDVIYVRGMGSLHRLSAFYSDLPCDVDQWHELAMWSAAPSAAFATLRVSPARSCRIAS